MQVHEPSTMETLEAHGIGAVIALVSDCTIEIERVAP